METLLTLCWACHELVEREAVRLEEVTGAPGLLGFTIVRWGTSRRRNHERYGDNLLGGSSGLNRPPGLGGLGDLP